MSKIHIIKDLVSSLAINIGINQQPSPMKIIPPPPALISHLAIHIKKPPIPMSLPLLIQPPNMPTPILINDLLGILIPINKINFSLLLLLRWSFFYGGMISVSWRNGLGMIRKLYGLCCLDGFWEVCVEGFGGGWIDVWERCCLGLGLYIYDWYDLIYLIYILSNWIFNYKSNN